MSVACFFKGHAWDFVRKNDEIRQGRVFVISHHFVRSHCSRCGKENPAWLGDATKIACKIIEKAKS